MPGTFVSRVAAGAVISAALATGSLSLTAAAASACPNPNCIRGVPPAAAATLECTDPKCLSGTQPAVAPWPGSRLTGRTGYGGPSARAAGGVSTAAAPAGASGAAINRISGLSYQGLG
jgi:hypothetical protein